MKRLLQYGIGILFLVLLVVVVDVEQVLAALSQMTLETAALLGLLSFILIFISALKWKLFLDRLHSKHSVWYLCELYLLGYFVNLILPSFLGGDAVRSWHVGKQGRQHEAAASTILERYTGLIAMLLIGLLMVWFAPGVTVQFRITLVVIAIAAAVASVLAMSPFFLSLLSKVPYGSLLLGPFKKVQSALAIAAKDPGLMARAMALSFLFHCATVINTLVAAWAVGWTEVPLLALFVVVPLILLVSALPIAPAGLGVQEGAFYFFLSGIGATPAQALGVGLVLRAKAYVLAALGAISFFRLKSKQQEEAASELVSEEGIQDFSV